MPELRRYEPPVITDLPFLAYSKHFPKQIALAAETDAPFDARALTKEFGTPLYVVSEERLRKDFRQFLSTFSGSNFSTQIAYSVKTNYLPAICSILKQEGAWAEIVSGMEYKLARALGFPGEQIVFNGPHKTREELEEALAEGALVNIDNFDELDLVEAIAASLDKPVRIGIRTSFEFGGIGWTKFGFNDDNGDSHAALRRIAENPRLRLDLIHNHCGTFVLIRELYAKSAERIIKLIQKARELGLSPYMMDIGGGFPSTNIIRPEHDVPGGSRRTGNFWLPYAEEICSRLEKARHLFDREPLLVMEPGRAIVDGCTQLLATVVGRKKNKGKPDGVIVDAGVNLIPTAVYYNHPLTRAGGSGDADYGHVETVDLYGPLCMQTDCIRTGASLPHLDVGDVVSISHVGAYCHSQSMQFIQTRPATVLMGPAGPELIRRREEWRDVFALDIVPDRIRDAGSRF